MDTINKTLETATDLSIKHVSKSPPPPKKNQMKVCAFILFFIVHCLFHSFQQLNVFKVMAPLVEDLAKLSKLNVQATALVNTLGDVIKERTKILVLASTEGWAVGEKSIIEAFP